MAVARPPSGAAKANTVEGKERVGVRSHARTSGVPAATLGRETAEETHLSRPQKWGAVDAACAHAAQSRRRCKRQTRARRNGDETRENLRAASEKAKDAVKGETTGTATQAQRTADDPDKH